MFIRIRRDKQFFGFCWIYVVKILQICYTEKNRIGKTAQILINILGGKKYEAKIDSIRVISNHDNDRLWRAGVFYYDKSGTF